MSYTPVINNSADYTHGTITVNYIDPVTGNINTLVFSGCDNKTIQSVVRSLRGRINR